MMSLSPSVKMHLQLIVLAVVLGAALACSDRQSYEGYKVFRVVATASQLDVLTQLDNSPGYDFWTRSRVAGAPLDIMVAPQQQVAFHDLLQRHDIEHSLLIQDVQVVFDAERDRQEQPAPRVEGKITHDKYYRHAEINAYLEEMATQYSTIAKVQSIGQSMMDKLDMKVLSISRGGTDNPAIWVDSGIHAREWLAPAMVLYIVDQLLNNSNNSYLLDGIDWHILPVVNPDGYEWSHTNTRLWRKTRSNVTSPSCPGVDANRNWDFHWMEVGASAEPCDATYGGPVAFSEPETVAVRDFLNNNTLDMYLTFHSYGNYILYPWGYTAELPADWETLDALAQEANDAQMSAGGANYTIGSSTNVLYAAAGCSDDWAKGVKGIALSYTIELPGGGITGFDMPAGQIEKHVSQFFEAVKVFGEYFIV